MVAGGSSPRVRGTVARIAIEHPRHRFIPACAGNGAFSAITEADPAVHPRVCGERLDKKAAGDLQTGSSPRVRGTVEASD